MVTHGGRHRGFTPVHAFRFNSQICPPPSRTETYPQSARRRNPERPSITFWLCETACAWEPDVVIVILWSLEILPALLRRAPRAPAQETRSCCRLGKHCGQRRRPLLPRRQLRGPHQGRVCPWHDGFHRAPESVSGIFPPPHASRLYPRCNPS